MSPDPSSRRTPAGLSRRRFIVLSAALAAAPVGLAARPATAAPVGAGPGHRDGKVASSDTSDLAYRRAFEAMLAEDGDVRRHPEPGREFLYRPGQLLVADDDVERVHDRLRKAGFRFDPGTRFAGFTRFTSGDEVDVPALVSWLRDPGQWSGHRPPVVQPHHVTVGFGNIMGNPGSAPRAAAPLPPPDRRDDELGAGVLVGVCDTGVWADAEGYHEHWLGDSYRPEADDVDPLYTHDDLLALQGGHGTFVAGVLRQAAPGVRFDPERALNRWGVGDEEMLVRALGRLDPNVSLVNLSLGCFTQDDRPPLPVVNALAALPPEVVVVAAAGNAGTDRPSWPAAWKNAVAVAGVATDGTVVPDPDSSYGPWVDACAVSLRHSTYVPGRLRLPDAPEERFKGFAHWRGTSFAAPHVAGRLAAVMTTEGLSAPQARQLLLAGPDWHPDYGVLVK